MAGEGSGLAFLASLLRGGQNQLLQSMQAAVSPGTKKKKKKKGTCVALRLQLGFLHEELALMPGGRISSEHHQGGPASSLRPFTEP